MSKLWTILILSLLLSNGARAGCDDAPVDGVDYSNCQFSEGQDLSRAYIPNSNLSFISFIKVTFDKGVMMNATLANGNFEKANFSSANLTRVNFKGSSLIETNFTNSNLFEADLTGANILNATFEGANLNNATWIDGTKCSLGSIGKCND